ncbi:hypothetical protein VNO77_22925 [Canavalia gladiata]|uniref:Uncharacterized protein n=1 Tax=Canavalia gladiata TaxID=3824 RepID=A0AAN9QB86_CANGL
MKGSWNAYCKLQVEDSSDRGIRGKIRFAEDQRSDTGLAGIIILELYLSEMKNQKFLLAEIKRKQTRNWKSEQNLVARENRNRRRVKDLDKNFKEKAENPRRSLARLREPE